MRLAQDPILAGFRAAGLLRERKRDGSVVTEADRAAEDVIRQHLRAAFPQIPVLGEERGSDGAGDLHWIVDPIDGTISFAAGVPLFGTLVALVDGDRPIVGVVALPALGEVWSGGPGLGVTCNGAPIRPLADDGTPERSIIAVGDPAQFRAAGLWPAWERLHASFPHVRAYCDAFGHALVLRGAVAAMCDPALAPWDLAATAALIEEAGGRLITRPSAVPGKVDALFGRPATVERIAPLIWPD